MQPGAVSKIKSQHIARAHEEVGESRRISKPEIKRRAALCDTIFAPESR
jgi:hypothetical protein